MNDVELDTYRCDWCKKPLKNGAQLRFIPLYSGTLMIHVEDEEEVRRVHKDEIIQPRDRFN